MEICDKTVLVDASGQGHCWRDEEIPAHIIEEIEGEMIDGGVDACQDFVASNGCHYRW